MTSPKKVVQVNLGDLLERALLKKGLRSPVTVEEVAAAEVELAKYPIEIPSELADPPEFKAQPHSLKARIISNAREPTPFDEEMGRAAREGGEITPEVEEKMKQDRIEAETQSGDAEK